MAPGWRRWQMAAQ